MDAAKLVQPYADKMKDRQLERCIDLIACCLSNSSVMCLKLQDWSAALKQCEHLIQGVSPSDPKYEKICIRGMIAANELKDIEKAEFFKFKSDGYSSPELLKERKRLDELKKST